MELKTIVESVFSLFFIILVGVYGSKKNIITIELNKGLTNILIQITLPCMIVSSFIFTYDNTIKSNILKTFSFSIIAYIIMAILSYLFLLPIKKDKKTILHFSNVFVNTGYIGFPILHSVYGPEGVIYGSIFNMFFVVFLWTYGISLYKNNFKKQALMVELQKILYNPSIIAVVIGITIMTFSLQLPRALLSSIKSIGNITGPLSMIIIGVILSKVKITKHLKDWTIYYGIAIKLIIIPFIIYYLSLLSGDNSKAIHTVVIMTAMPASAMTSILAENYNKEKEYAAMIVSITTLFSLITIPLLIKMIMC